MTVLPTWGPGRYWSDEDHSREFPQASTQQSWVKAVPPWDASPGSLWSCTSTCTIEAVELGNLVYDSSASSVSEYFIKSCHYWLGSLPSYREDPMEVIFYFCRKLGCSHYLKCLYASTTQKWFSWHRNAHCHTHVNLCAHLLTVPTVHQAHWSLHTVTRSSVQPLTDSPTNPRFDSTLFLK